MAETIQQGECIEKIMNAFAKIGHELTNKQAEQFFQYYEMLVETNKVMNLTAITEFDEVLQKHFVDSVLKSEIFIKEDTKTLIDVGTGAGFPGVPLKIMYPQLKVTLLDSLNKRLNFLNQVIEKLGLENITTVHYRAEDGARKAELREQFDCVVSRAVANMSTLCEYCLPYAKVGGCFVAYKSGNAEEEIDKAKKAVHLLGGVKENAIYFDLPDSDIGRSLVIVKKKENEVFFMEKKFEVSEFALEAVRHFEFSGTLTDVRPFGNGHINDTYLAEYDIFGMGNVKVIIQRMNRNVFKQPEELMENIVNVTEFLKKKIEKNQKNRKNCQ